MTGIEWPALVAPMNHAGKTSEYAQRSSPVLRVQESGVATHLVEAKSYEAMRRRLHLLEGLARGEKAIAGGKVTSHARAKKRFARWLK